MKFTTPAVVFVFFPLLLIVLPGEIVAFSDCGGILNEKKGTVRSPGYPLNYPNDAACNWTIIAAVNEIIDIRFSMIDLDGNSFSCPDIVTVFDGDNWQATPIMRFCTLLNKTELDSLSIRSTGNKMYITFTSDYRNTRKGFISEFTAQECPLFKYGRDICNKTCSCVVNNTLSCNNVNGSCLCKQGWSGPTCSVDINECLDPVTERCPSYHNCINTPGSFSCQCKDGLIKNVTTGDCQVNSTSACGNNSCSHLCVKLPPKNTTQCYCPDDTILTKNNCSACPPLKYGKNCTKSCKCFSGENGHCNSQTGECICNTGWTSSDCSEDVNECITLAARICTDVGLRCVNTFGSFVCDCPRGFEPAADKTCVPLNCNNKITATSGTVKAPYYPSTYWPNAVCSWTIAVTAPLKISLQVIDLPDDYRETFWQQGTRGEMYHDYIEVYDGGNASAQMLGRYFRMNRPISTIRSTGNMLHIIFRSDSYSESGSFMGNYIAYGYNFYAKVLEFKRKISYNDHPIEDYPSQKYLMTVNHTQQIIQSPGYPIYKNNTFCYWLITKTFGDTLSLRVKSLDVGSNGKSFLAIYDGSSAGYSLILKAYGTSIPPLIRLKGNAMFIVFQSDGSATGKGFNGTVHSQVCPDYTYGQEECTNDCICVQSNTWYCDSVDGKCICRVGWNATDCSVDINECLKPSSCTPTEKCINTPGSFYCLPDCNKDLSGNGPIQTKDYPNIQLYNAKCNFTITGNPSTVVTLVIAMEDFELLESRDCNMDSLEIYNKEVIPTQLICTYCGTRLPNIIRSTDRTMLLKLKTYYDSRVWTRKGFRGQYYTHPCPAFKYGITCQFSCTCDQTKTEFCDNINGICVCKSGWMGSDCSDDVNECRFPKCAVNEVCQNLPGSFNCSCKNGFAKNANGLCVNVRASCTSKIKTVCSHSCYYDSATQADTCSCPDGLELGTTDKTKYMCVIPYYPYGQSVGDMNLTTLNVKVGNSYRNANPIVFTSPTPFGESLRTEAYVFSNGLIGFDKIEVSEEPDLQAAAVNKIELIAPFWAKTDSTKGQTFYHLYEKCDPSDFNEESPVTNSPSKSKVLERAANEVKEFAGVYDFDVSRVLLVTWVDLQPPELTDTKGNTFQAVYISGFPQVLGSDEGFTDEEHAYVHYFYQKGQMQWPYKIGRVPIIGYVKTPSTIFTVTVTEKSFDIKEASYLESYMTEVSRNTTSVQKCQKHVCKNSRLINNFAYRSEIQQLYNCPCTVGQLGLQWMFFENRGQDIYCYAISAVAKRRLLGSNPRNKLCCYKWKQPPGGSAWETWADSIALSSFIHNTADAGHVLVGDQNWFRGVQENLDAHQWCCKDAKDSKMCGRFNSIYPDMDCSYTVTFVPAYLLGDPHVITFDNLTYTMNGLGEWTLMDILSINFILQARTSQVKSSNGVLTNATVFTAFAATEGDYARFQVELSFDKKTMVILVDGFNYTTDFYRNATFRLAKEYIDISRDNRFNKTKVAALFPSNVIVQVNVGVDCLELNLEVDKDLRNKTKGLLGNFNGRKDDEFLLPNGTVLPANMTEEQIYRNFATKYQVTTATSVFIYANGMTADNFTKAGFTPVFRSSFSNSSALFKEAVAVCGVGEELCIYDYLVTGDKRFAANTKSTQAFSITSRKTLENHIPNITVANSTKFVNQRWFVQEGVVNTLRFTATDEDGDLLIYLLDGSPKGASVNQSGILTYTPNSLEPVNIGVRVKDTKNGYSPILYVPILICPRCSGHGTCDLNNTRNIEFFDGLVQVLKCACLPAYIGDSCATEKDACKSKPCSKGQNCTDLTAAQQGNSSIGHVCGPCPAGFEDLNKRCIDKDECNGSKVCDQICTNTEGSYRCSCNDGFVVSALNPRTCLAKNCSNRCVSENTRYCNESISQCVCKAGITTDDCSVNSCLSNPCTNNLPCKPKGNGYECLCMNGLPQNLQSYRCIDCNRTLTEASGKLMSTNYPANYPDQSYCTWTIVSGQTNAIITLNITDFDVEGCPFDYLEVYDGNSSKSNMIGQYCETVPKTIVSSGNALHVVFTTDESVNLRGFIASYVAESQCKIKKCSHTCQVVSTNPRVEKCVCPAWARLDPRNDTQCIETNACNTTVTNSTGFIVSPGYPQKYPANVTCSWNIPASQNTVITLSFSDLDMESAGATCPYDSIAVYNGSSVAGTLLGVFCGGFAPQNVTLPGGAGMYIVFQSDATLSGRGFKAQYIITAK